MATKRGKRYVELAKLVDREKLYSLEEAFDTLTKTKSAKFNETVDLAIKLGVDPRHADQQVRGTVVLPNGTGKDIKILVIAEGDDEKAAKDAGATHVGGEEMIEKIKTGWLDFDIVISTPKMMPKIGKVGKILGTKGLMPTPKAGTVVQDITSAVSEFKKGKIAFKVDKFGSIHVPLGKIDFGKEKVLENFKTFMTTLMKLKPESSKGQYLKGVCISTTMGPGIKMDPSEISKIVTS